MKNDNYKYTPEYGRRLTADLYVLTVLLVVFLLILTPSGYAKNYPAIFQESAESPFGIVFNQDPGREEKAFAALQELGVRWVRVRIGWNTLEPKKGVYDEKEFSELDAFIERLTEEKINIVGFLSSGSVPVWALQGDFQYKKKKSDKPKARRKAIKNTPPKPEDLRDFLTYLIKRYRGRIKNWIILNEVVGSESKVTPEALAEIMQVVYKAAKDSDPECNIIMAGIGGPRYYETYYEGFFSLGGGAYVDVINRHMYRHLSRIPREIPRTREIMKKYKVNKPIQIGEFANPGFSNKSVPERRTSAGPWNYPEGSYDAQAQLLVKRMVLSVVNGTVRMFQSRMRDKQLPLEEEPKESKRDIEKKRNTRRKNYGNRRHGWMKWSKGIVDYNYKPKPAFYAYKTLIQKLDEARFDKELFFGEHLRVFVFEKNKRPLVVLWAWGKGDRNTEIILRVKGQEVKIFDKLGKEVQRIRPDQDHIRLMLTPEPMYLEGAVEVGGGTAPPPYQSRYPIPGWAS